MELVLLAVFAGFLCLQLGLVFDQAVTDVIAAALFTGLPLVVLVVVAGSGWRALPFLALLWWFTRRGTHRNRAVVLAWVITAVGFGLVHLPTYDWNVVQCVLVIGGARIILTLAYIRTKNLWVSTGAHVINDWTLFTTPVVIGALT